MKTHALLIALLVALTPGYFSTAVGEEEKTQTTYTSLGMAAPRTISITIDGSRYKGVYCAVMPRNKEFGKFARSYSALVLIPVVEGAPKASIGTKSGFNQDMTLVGVGGEKFPVWHRRLCVTDDKGTFLKIFNAVIPLDAYKSEERLKEAVSKIISNAG